MFWSKNKKKVYPCKPQFYYIKVGCKGVFVTRTCFRDGLTHINGTSIVFGYDDDSPLPAKMLSTFDQY